MTTINTALNFDFNDKAKLKLYLIKKFLKKVRKEIQVRIEFLEKRGELSEPYAKK